MPSMKAVMQAIVTLQLGNPKSGPQGEEATAATAQLWTVLFGDLPDATLGAAVIAHLRSPKAHFFPQPGNLLALIPSQRGAVDDAEEAWTELAGKVQGVAMLVLYPNQDERYHHGVLRLQGNGDRCKAQLAWLDSRGGPRSLIQMDQRGLDFARSDFLRSYRSRMGTAAQRIEDRKVLALVSAQPRIGGDS